MRRRRPTRRRQRAAPRAVTAREAARRCHGGSGDEKVVDAEFTEVKDRKG